VRVSELQAIEELQKVERARPSGRAVQVGRRGRTFAGNAVTIRQDGGKHRQGVGGSVSGASATWRVGPDYVATRRATLCPCEARPGAAPRRACAPSFVSDLRYNARGASGRRTQRRSVHSNPVLRSLLDDASSRRSPGTSRQVDLGPLQPPAIAYASTTTSPVGMNNPDHLEKENHDRLLVLGRQSDGARPAATPVHATPRPRLWLACRSSKIEGIESRSGRGGHR